jgi:hypothetical protein
MGIYLVLAKLICSFKGENLKFAGGSPAAGYFFLCRQEKVTKKKGAPDSDSRSVEREGAARLRLRLSTGAYAAAPAPQASLTVSQPPPALASSLGGSQGVS